MKYWETNEFKILKQKWEEKLALDGFSENLKELQKKTILYQNRERILDFFMKLDEYLYKCRKIPQTHRKILNLYKEGIHIAGKNGIEQQTGLSNSGIRKIINIYKIRVLKYYGML